MDLTLYVFDSRKTLRAVITRGIVQLIHKERARTLSAEIPTTYAAEPGEYLGFRCVDGKFRLFTIEYADRDDNTATTIITATDAAKDALVGAVVSVTEQEGAVIAQAATELLAAIGWTIGKDESESRVVTLEGGLRGAWAVLEDMETAGNLYADPYFEFDGKEITGRVVDLLAKKKTYRGRFVQRGTDAENIVITKKNRPRPMIFGMGADGLTIGDVVWSKEKGNPVDKPAGQLWIGVPEAVAKYPGQGQVCEVNTDDQNELMDRCWEKAQQSAEPSVTATATISDMEMAAGQEWKSVRIWDMVRVRPRYGADVEAQIIEIARNYVRPDETKITIGEEPDSSAKAIKGLTKTTAANVRDMNKYKAQFKDMLVTVKELDEYTRTTITEAWIDLKASTESSFAQIGSRLDNTDAQNEEQFRTLSESMLTLQNDLDSATTELLARIIEAEGTTQSVSEAILRLDAELDSATAELSARVDDNEAAIILQATELGTRIDLKADITYVQRLVADEIEAAFANVEISWADLIRVETLYVLDNAYVTNEVQAGRLSVSSIANFNGGLYANSGIQVAGNASVSGGLTAASVDTDTLRFKDNTISLKTATFLTPATSIQVVSSGGVVSNVEFYKRAAAISYLSWEESED